MTAAPSDDIAARLLACLERPDAEGAIELAVSLVDAGVPVREVVDRLADVQRTVGERWQRNEWSVAEEHAASAIADRMLAALAATVSEPVVHPAVLVVCGEGEWHTLAGRMLTDLLRAYRWDARFLGGSIPAPHLASHLELEAPLALAVTCSIPMFLPGALDTIEAAQSAGTPVLAGGRGFGSDARRARALGANGWAPDATAADALLQDWARSGAPPPEEPEPAARSAYRALRERRRAIVESAEAELHERLPYLQTATSEQLARTREDLEYLAAFVEATVLTDDTSILTEYLPWLVEVLESRHVPLSVLPPTNEAFVAALERHAQHEAARRLAAAAAATIDRIGNEAG